MVLASEYFKEYLLRRQQGGEGREREFEAPARFRIPVRTYGQL